MNNFLDLEIRILQRRDEEYPVEMTIGDEQHFHGLLSCDILPWTSTGDQDEDGYKLSQALFASNALRTAWNQARGQSNQRRIRLRIDEDAPELHTLPWELLREGDVTISANADTPFSRYLAVSGRWGGAVKERPIRVLAVISNPDDLEDYNMAPLDVDTERNILTEAFSKIDKSEVELTFLDPPVTLKSIEKALQNGYHILHYVGHGRFNKKRKQTVLYLQDDQGDTDVVRDTAFIEMLTRQSEQVRPRLIFLASCETATTSTAAAFRGLGPRLVKIGVPAVVAMQDFVDIQTAQELSLAFYQRLADHGTVDCAMNEARSILLTVKRPDAAVPVLFMRFRDGQLWENETDEDIDVGSSTTIIAKDNAVVATHGGVVGGQVAVGGDVHGGIHITNKK
ncbi:MAG: CHAT domain-containing protein [Chloroflexi bacterium]|nr:CHAT domain-containing protein [Chloroflexota bacterium]